MIEHKCAHDREKTEAILRKKKPENVFLIPLVICSAVDVFSEGAIYEFDSKMIPNALTSRLD